VIEQFLLGLSQRRSFRQRQPAPEPGA
jgi:hypothetical protein